MKTLVSQKIIATIGLKKTWFKIPRIFDLENVIGISAINLVDVGMRTEEAFYNIFMYLYNKNILEYGQITRNGT